MITILNGKPYATCTKCGTYERAWVAEHFGGLCAACGYDGLEEDHVRKN